RCGLAEVLAFHDRARFLAGSALGAGIQHLPEDLDASLVGDPVSPEEREEFCDALRRDGGDAHVAVVEFPKEDIGYPGGGEARVDGSNLLVEVSEDRVASQGPGVVER